MACIFISFLESPINVCAAQDELSLSAQSAVVICADTGEVIYGKNQNEKRPMASTTKILTSLLALEAAESCDREVTITDKMVPVEGSSMYLQLGQKLPLTSLAKGMLTVSGNDAANSVAIFLGGSVEGFAKLMNEKAKQIGMNNTNFVTPSGLDAENHYSTAYDMALLGAYALENQSFYDICSKRKVDVPFIEPCEIRTLYNENRLLKRYDGCIGIKTGFTKRSGRCLVSGAERNRCRLVAVTLNAGDDWNDHEKLLDYGFLKVESVPLDECECMSLPLVGGNVDEITVFAKDDMNLTLLKGQKDKIEKVVKAPQFVYAPIEKGKVIGKIEYKFEGKIIATNDLIVSTDENIFKENKNLVSKIIGFFKGFFN